MNLITNPAYSFLPFNTNHTYEVNSLHLAPHMTNSLSINETLAFAGIITVFTYLSIRLIDKYIIKG